MTPTPVLVLLFVDAALLLAASLSRGQNALRKDSLFLGLLFFCSGMPALIYQIVWQRALFAIYGVNSQSVTVVVTAFMLGLGLGSLIGGFLSSRFPRHGILLFGLAELGVAVFGLASLHIFRWIAGFTAGSNLPAVIVYSLALLLVPTVLMGATLPLLVEHLVARSHSVGSSVSTLYFVNTFGSAAACFLCATYLLREFGQSGSVTIAALINVGVGGTAYLLARRPGVSPLAGSLAATQQSSSKALSLPAAMFLAGLSGFIALGFEIAWFRVYSLAASDRAPAFAMLLAVYLSGIAAGTLVTEKLTGRRSPQTIVVVIGALLVAAGALSAYLPPLVAMLMARSYPFLYSAPAFFVTAALVGSVLPLVCQVSISADEKSGQNVSLVYLSNILGCAAGSLGIGFVLMQYVGLRTICLGLGLLAIAVGAWLLFSRAAQSAAPRLWSTGAIALAIVTVFAASGGYTLLFERLIFGHRQEASIPFVHVVENRNGVIGVTRERAVFGGGVYDGYFNVDPMDDVNLVARIYALSAFCPRPRRILVIGLASGSWAQILVNHPGTQVVDAVEINPGYVQLIKQYPMVQSFLTNPKVHLYIDDGRRWLLAHPGVRYDAIVANTTYNWRDHSTTLLSVEYLNLIRAHLEPGGVYYFNSTESDDTLATALHVFPYGLRVINFGAVSDSPVTVDAARWLAVMREYTIDGKLVFKPGDPAAEKVLAAYMALAETVNQPPRFFGIETGSSMRARLGKRRIITDDNMGEEWRSMPAVPWH